MTTLRLVFLALLVTGLPCALKPALAAASPVDLDVLRQLNRSFVEIANKVSASVVVINVIQKETAATFEDADEEDGAGSMPPGFWRKFHEQFKHAPVEKTIGQGSGVIIRQNGYILTNGHVIEDAESVTVRLQDGK